MLDSPTEHGAQFWEFYCDLVIRLDRTHPATMAEGYMLRTLEIIKARYQHHAWGPHQLKIYERNDPEQKDPSVNSETPNQKRQRLERAHPFRKDGGIFIYPSIHYLVSTYKRTHPGEEPNCVDTPIRGFNSLLPDLKNDDFPGGIPEGRCTALLGVRGGHKSYVGFMHVVHRVLNRGEAGLIVSLRDDVGVTTSSIDRILSEWRDDPNQVEPNPHKDAAQLPEWMHRSRQEIWEDDFRKRLDIMYFPPGNITAEEFIHRLLLSILRLKSEKSVAKNSMGENAVTLLFNSLDQLEPRFPLCARERIFLPIQLAQAAQPPREAAGHDWRRRARCLSLADRR
jgi:hypothetical protein